MKGFKSYSLNEHTDRHDWKHYLPAHASGNKENTAHPIDMMEGATYPIHYMVQCGLGVDLARLADRVYVLKRISCTRHVTVDPEHLPLQLQDVVVHLEYTSDF